MRAIEGTTGSIGAPGVGARLCGLTIVVMRGLRSSASGQPMPTARQHNLKRAWRRSYYISLQNRWPQRLWVLIYPVRGFARRSKNGNDDHPHI
jgi:hypothetical protein